MDGVAISIIGRPRPLPSHDTPNAAHNTYTLKCEEPVKPAFSGVVPRRAAMSSLSSSEARSWTHEA